MSQMKATRILISAALTLTALAAMTVFAQNAATAQVVASMQSSSSPAPANAAFSDSADPAVQPANPASHNYGPVSFRRNGLWFSTEDGSTHLQVHGYLQADDRMFSSTTHGEELNTFLFRRVRPLFEGTLFNAVDFRFMPDFGQYN